MNVPATATDNKRFVEGIFRQRETVGNLEPFIETLSDDLCWVVTGK